MFRAFAEVARWGRSMVPDGVDSHPWRSQREREYDDLYFFLSYARGDDDTHVHQFFRDLSAEVRVHAGLGAGREVGFLDARSLEVGARWPSRLVDALSRCRSFVALLTPRYLVSGPCGKEWTIFAERVRRYERDVGISSSALLPLHWLPPPRLPDAVAALVYDHHSLPPAYQRAGLRQLMRLQRLRDHYLEFVSEFARQIVENAERHRLPPAPQGLNINHVSSVLDIYSGAVATRSVGQQRAKAPAGQRVRFIVAAPSREDLDSGELSERRTQDYYGERAQDWSPYQPNMPRPIAEFARGVALERNFEPDVADSSRLVEHLVEAGEHNHIVVLLVDPWATRLDEPRLALADFNTRDIHIEASPHAVMVPGGHDDAETQAHWRPLADSVRAIFSRRAGHGDEVMFRTRILTHDAFDADLEVVLEVARNRVLAGSRANRPVDGEAGPLPSLQAP